MFKSKTRTQLEAGIRYMIREASPKKHSSDDILHAINDVAIDLWDELSLMAGADWCETITTPVDVVITSVTSLSNRWSTPRSRVRACSASARRRTPPPTW